MKCGQRQGGVLSELSSFVHFLTGIKIRIKEEGVKNTFYKIEENKKIGFLIVVKGKTN